MSALNCMAFWAIPGAGSRSPVAKSSAKARSAARPRARLVAAYQRGPVPLNKRSPKASAANVWVVTAVSPATIVRVDRTQQQDQSEPEQWSEDPGPSQEPHGLF